MVAQDLQRRYLDIAIDAALATRENAPAAARFHWTVEAAATLDAWWKTARPQRREKFLEACARRTDRCDRDAVQHYAVCERAAQWDVMTHWLPESLWTTVHPGIAMQDDVNGFLRARRSASAKSVESTLSDRHQ